jgi:hypothetical protein
MKNALLIKNFQLIAKIAGLSYVSVIWFMASLKVIVDAISTNAIVFDNLK